MCGGAYYLLNGEPQRVYFPNPQARLPVQRHSGECLLLPWGRRKQQAGSLPPGGWARLDSIYSGRWDRWFPKPVKIPLLSFMERDIEGRGHWFDITPGHWVQGLLAREQNEIRIYVVTIEPELESAIHERWPRILAG